MKSWLSRLLHSAALLISAGALAGCVATSTMDDCPGDSELIGGQCVGVDEDGNPK